MILTRDKGKRMWGGQGGSGGSGNGGGSSDPSMMAGFASQAWVDENYVSKEFFNQMFAAKGLETVYTSDDNGQTWTQDGDPTAITFLPNEMPSEVITDGETAGTKVKTVRAITSIEAKKGLWTNFYLSALGQNSGGGGGGGGDTLYEPLISINESGLAAPSAAQDGMTVVWDNSTKKWKYGSVGSGQYLPLTGGTLTNTAWGQQLRLLRPGGTPSLYFSDGSTEFYIYPDTTPSNRWAVGYTSGGADHSEQLALVSDLAGYLPLTGGTMRGVIALDHSQNNYSSAINVGLRTLYGTRADTYTSGSWIHGGEDNASYLGANVQIGTWYGFGIYPTIEGQTRTQGQNSFWHNARTGDTYTWGNFYCYDGTNNNKVATEPWVNIQLNGYLPLTGGTMANTNLVTNMNADRLDGFHANDMLVHYHFLCNVTANNYWHKLGEYETGGDSSNLIIEIFSGAGYNGLGSQNTWAKIIIKDGWQETQAAEYSVGVSVEQFGYYGYGDIKVIVVATAHNRGAVWVQLPWQYAYGDYVVYGLYTSWTHNDSIETDTTTAPTSNQDPVYYYRNLSYLNTAGGEAVTLPHNLSVMEGVNGAQLRIGNMLLSYDATNKALKIEHQGSNGVEAGNIYATGGVSALGQSSGGGGGGSTTLAGLSDVSLSNPTNGQILQYNGTHWVNANAPQTGVTSISAGTGLTTNVSGGGDITSTGTISISQTYQTYISHGESAYNWINTNSSSIVMQSDISDMATKTWVVQQGFLTSSSISDMATQTWVSQNFLTSVAFSDLTSHPTTLGGYGITDAKFGTAGSDYVPITLGGTTKNVLTAHQSLSDYATQTWVGQNYLEINATAAAATQLDTVRTLWGQSFNGTANVTGDMTSVGNITAGLGTYFQLAGGPTSGKRGLLIEGINTGNDTISFGFNSAANNIYWDDSGDGIVMQFIRDTLDNSVRHYAYLREGLRIGNAYITWDSTNNALKVQKADGTAANLYATGAVSALGANTSGGGGGGGGNVYENLTVENTLNFIKNGYTSRIYGDNNGYLHIDGSEWIVMGNDLKMDGYSIHTQNGNVECGTGNVYAGRFYVGTGRYIYLDGTTLKYYDNGIARTINLT